MLQLFHVCVFPDDGTGTNVYIIDTGVSPDHVDFGGAGGRCEMSFDAIGGVVSRHYFDIILEKINCIFFFFYHPTKHCFLYFQNIFFHNIIVE